MADWNAGAVMIDDGGSARLRLLIAGGWGDMKGLLDVDDKASPPQSTHPVPGPYVHATLVWLDETAAAFPVVDTALNPGDNFTIVSGNGQSVKLTIDPTSQCIVTVSGSPNVSPMVEAKQFNHKRHYMVSNAGPIKTVDGIVGGKNIKQFDAKAVGSVYTMLLLRK
jgi:hypothetical protein